MTRRYGVDYRAMAEQSLELWWQRWAPSLDRHDDLLATVREGDNLAFLAKQMGLGRANWLAKALVEADMWDRRILVLCAPMLKRYWCEQLLKEGFPAMRIEALSVYQARKPGIRAEAELLSCIDRADVVIIEPNCRPKTKLFAGLAKQVREAGRAKQIITTATMVWSAELKPPLHVDSALKLLGYLDDPVKVAWAEDCWEGEG